MASPAEMNDRNDMTLWASDVMLDDLLARAHDWSARPEREQLDFFLEWEEMMDRLSAVAEDEASGLLTTLQRDRLTRLARRLIDSRPVIEEIGLDYPNLGRLSLAS